MHTQFCSTWVPKYFFFFFYVRYFLYFLFNFFTVLCQLSCSHLLLCFRSCAQTWRSCVTSTWRELRTDTLRSARAAGRWTDTASGSPDTGRATSLDANTTSGRRWSLSISVAIKFQQHLASIICKHAFLQLSCVTVVCSALYVVDLKKFRKIAAGDRLRGQYQGLSQDPNSLSNLDQVWRSLHSLSTFVFLCPRDIRTMCFM